jgi:hypothetical protein
MSGMRSSGRRGILLPLVLFAACKSWSGHPAPRPTDVMRLVEGDVRLHMRNGSRIVMHNVSFEGDSVIGLFLRDTTRRALPVADVIGVEEKSVSTSRTTLLILGLSAAAIGMAIAFASAGTPPGY